jgi:hypothetical protein
MVAEELVVDGGGCLKVLIERGSNVRFWGVAAVGLDVAVLWRVT